MALAASRESLIVELAGGGALVEELSKWRGERRVLRGHEGS